MTRLFRPTEYFRPKTIKEALSMLSEYGRHGKVIAGGTDVMVERPPETKFFIDIASLSLAYIKKCDGNWTSIGALTTASAIEESNALRRGSLSVLSEASRLFAYNGVRNLATIGGNICSAVPSADFPPALIALKAKVRIIGPGGEREVVLDSFFVGPRKTVLEVDELLTEIVIPDPPNHSGTVFLKSSRTSVDLAIVNVATSIQLDESGLCREARVALGAVAPTPLRATKSEKVLLGQKMDLSVMEEAAHIAAQEITPISDVRASAEYRKQLSEVLVKRALQEALTRARESDHP